MTFTVNDLDPRVKKTQKNVCFQVVLLSNQIIVSFRQCMRQPAAWKRLVGIVGNTAQPNKQLISNKCSGKLSPLPLLRHRAMEEIMEEPMTWVFARIRTILPPG